MTEEKLTPKADAAGDKLDAILSALGSLAARVDSMEKNLPAPPLVNAADKRKDDDEEEEAKKDDDDKSRKDAEGSNKGEEKGTKAGEIKPDDEGEVEHPGHIEFKKDDDDEEEDMRKDDDEAMKADEEAAKYADAQAKCDSVMSAFGKSASRPLQGESIMSYRKRLLNGLKAYSDSYKDISLASIKDAKLLDLAEKQIFADALNAAKSPTMYAADQEIEIHERDRAGRVISKFKGGMGWLDAFKVPSYRVKEFHLNNKR